MTGIYSLRRADRSVQIAVLLFLAVLGSGYLFAFFMVRTYAGLSPAAVATTYAPAEVITPQSLPNQSSADTEALDLSSIVGDTHRVDTNLLIQDSHVHLVLYAVVAALESIVILGLDWGPGLRDSVILLAFAGGILDFGGQWLMHVGIARAALITIAGGWTMAAVYVMVVAGTVRTLTTRAAVIARRSS